MKDEKKLSKMMQNYLEKKKEYPDCILFYRLGDFYEMFFDDAVLVSNTLGITLTSRECGWGKEDKAPMCGVPFHAADTYISRLTKVGLKIAICEQLSEPIKGQLVDRDVVRIVTPGTIIDDTQLGLRKNNFIASVSAQREGIIGLSWLDITTGEFFIQQFTGDDAFFKLSDVLVSINPSEIICDKFCFEKSVNIPSIKMGVVPYFYCHTNTAFEYDTARRTIIEQLKIKDLASIKCENKLQAICAAGGLIDYLTKTQMRNLAHINSLRVINDGYYMHLDMNTRLNLEICQTLYDRKQKGSLLWVLDKTKTTMGARLLYSWLEQPLQDEIQINDRLDAIEELTKNTIARNNLINSLRGLQDLERLCGKVSYGNLSPKNCRDLGFSLEKIPQIKISASCFKSKLITKCINNIITLDSLTKELTTAFIDDAPTTIKDGGFIADGFDEEFDKCKRIEADALSYIAALEQKEKENTGIQKLKITYNRVTGYYFEVPKTDADKMPERFQREQTLASTVRFMSTDLQQIRSMIDNGLEIKLNTELKIFNRIRNDILDKLVLIQQTSRQIAMLDVLASLAEVAVDNNYCKPEINSNITTYEIIESRHPVVEKLVTSERFVPNDVLFNNDHKVIIITGPNMAGKSTYMRQIALIALLAHVGSFVPAKSAKISITDRIFTRIGASDNLGMGQSTFMVEMTEVANIIKNATPKSLLILDEIGRGTSTQDGLSIAWSVLEYLSTSIKANTLFATHYHRLTELQSKLPGVVNMRVTVSEFDNKMSFLRKVEYGSTNQSFGVEVAKLAGVPNTIINRAKEIMKTQENQLNETLNPSIEQYKSQDLSIKTKYEMICEILNKTDVNNLTPLEAFSKIAELKQKIQ